MSAQPAIDRKVGKGKVIYGKTVRKFCHANRRRSRFRIALRPIASTFIDFIHRTTDEAEMYFLANRNDRSEKLHGNVQGAGEGAGIVECGDRRAQKSASNMRCEAGRTSIALQSEPYGSMFVVFPVNLHEGLVRERKECCQNAPRPGNLRPVGGVQFDRNWFYPVRGLTGEQRPKGSSHLRVWKTGANEKRRQSGTSAEWLLTRRLFR